MLNEMTINVLDPRIGDAFASALLGMTETNPDTGDAIRRCKQRLRDALVAEGLRAGSSMNVARAINDVVGPRAVAQALLAGDHRLIQEEVQGVSLRLRGEPERRRRWRKPPLEVFEMPVPRFSPEVHFVVAPAEYPEHEYERWILIERALAAIGVTERGVDAVFRILRARARRYRVLLDGRVQVIRCMPEWVSYMTLGLFDEQGLSRNPHWANPARHADLAAAAKQYNDVVVPHLIPRMDNVTEAGSHG